MDRRTGFIQFDITHQTDQLLQRACQSTKTWIEGGGLIRVGVPDSLLAHTHHVDDGGPSPG